MIEAETLDQEVDVEELIKRGLKRWNLADWVKTEEDFYYYLEAAVAEDPGDGSFVRAALGDVARLQQRNMTHLAKAAGMSREGLHKALSPKGNPSFATMLKILRALDLELRIVPASASSDAV